jgi:cystathionine beta-lyase/cystathionine gamma-synthase
LVRSVTHRFATADELDRYNQGKEPNLFLYARYDNPTVAETERQLAQLEGTEEACLFSSGMAAASTAVLTYAGAGERVAAARTVYGGMFRFLRDTGSRFGLRSEFFDSDVLLEASGIPPDTKVVYFETPINPSLRLVDAKAVARAAKAAGAISIVDSTFAPPPIQTWADLKTDLVVHSVTKYLNGHSDVLGGVVMGTRAKIEPVRHLQRVLGNNIDPAAAWELMRSLKTLGVRLDRQQASALELAKRLSAHPKVESVSYPGLEGFPDHVLANRQMHGYGAMVSFVVPGGYRSAARVFDALDVIERAGSLGSVESLVSLPVISSHTQMSPEELARAGVSPGMVRISVGLESVDALWADLKQAIEAAG